jgi:hypothetical protein
MSFTVLNPRDVRDISPDVLDADGRLKVMPAAYYKALDPNARALFGHRRGVYSLPTVELVEFLRRFIGTRSAIEIGSGNGVLAQELNIPATDSRMQEDPAIAAHYALSGQPVVTYGPNVEKLDGHAAVAKYRPQVVISCWVTHKYDERRHEAGGNMFGIDEEALIARCESYVVVGNRSPHRGKSIWALPHVSIEPDWLFSRSVSGLPDFIAVWGKVPDDIAELETTRKIG